MYIFSYARFSDKSIPYFPDELHQIFSKIRKLFSLEKQLDNEKTAKIIRKLKRDRNCLKNIMPGVGNIMAITRTFGCKKYSPFMAEFSESAYTKQFKIRNKHRIH